MNFQTFFVNNWHDRIASGNQFGMYPKSIDYHFPQYVSSYLLKEKGLTPREIQVLEWVARGKTNEQIGLILNIHPRTTAKHLEHIYSKLAVTTRVEAVVHLLQMMQPGWSAKGTDPELTTD